ncbi:hypothetical protein [Streptomyces sp. NPDC050804]|uniref:hypothetical protein n=1 Tax=Streptomyces sp. NPDC050804 TaxID=3154745 RepID=UPI003418AFF7
MIRERPDPGQWNLVAQRNLSSGTERGQRFNLGFNIHVASGLAGAVAGAVAARCASEEQLTLDKGPLTPRQSSVAPAATSDGFKSDALGPGWP